MPYHYHKYHALGNDYIVIDPAHFNLKLSRENIRLICDRHYGIGSDGILYGPIIEDGNIKLKIFNPDGSEAEKSGNGIRIFSRYLYEEKYVKKPNFEIHTLGGKVKVAIIEESGELIKVDMGTVTFYSKQIPVNLEEKEMVDYSLKIGEDTYKVTCLSIGNPHCVIPMIDISKDKALKLGPIVENHPIFPNKINMQIMKVLDRNNIQIEIWERGAGYTMASGSSSCAAASAAYKLGYVDNKINVIMPGGIIEIFIDDNEHVHMTGKVDSVGKGIFSESFIKQLFPM